ncbi:MAG: sigma 54-interacting transcriptional regulator [Planctomycetota bacterium]
MLGKNTLHAGRYLVLDHLGEGATSDVYKTYDNVLDELVALKVFKPLLSPAEIARQEEEYHLLKRLDHPGIVRAYDRGPGWFTLEFVEGTLLSRPIPRDFALILRIVIQMAEAVGHIHKQGIVHRDLKPEHVMLTRGELVKIIDFNLAQAPAGATPAGDIAGTPDYLAPEILAGGPPSPPGDLYALGVVFYELVTRRLPFPPATSLATAMAERMKSAPVPPRRHNPLLPAELEPVILRLLEKDPARRFASAEELLAALVPLTAAASITATKEETGAKLLAPPRFTGRRMELEALNRFLGATGIIKSNLLLVRGGRGSGKTRLLAEFRTRGDFGRAIVVATRFDEVGKAPLRPFGELLLGLTDVLVEQEKELLPGLLRKWGTALLRFAPALAERPYHVPPDEEAVRRDDLPSGREPSFRALCQFFAEASARRPLVFILEDLHWMDTASSRLLEWMITYFVNYRILLVGAYSDNTRTGFDPFLRMFLRLKKKYFCREIPLAPLADRETAEMTLSMLGGGEVETAVFDNLLKVTRGIPFAVEEATRAVVEHGIIFKRGGKWTLDAEKARRTPVIVVLDDLLVERAKELSEKFRRVLSLLAVAGGRADFGLLEHLSGLGREELFYILDELAHLRFLVKEPAEPPRWSLQSPKLRGFFLRQIPERERMKLHGSAGKFLERQHRDAPDEVVEMLARLFLEAGDTKRARGYLLRAAACAETLSADADAVELYTRALTIIPPGDNKALAETHLALARAHLRLNDFKAAAAAARTGAAIERDRPAGALAPLLLAWSEALAATGNLKEAEPKYRAALEAARAERGAPALAAALQGAGEFALLRGEFEEAHRAFTELEILADRNGRPRERAAAGAGLAEAEIALGRSDAARAVWDKARTDLERAPSGTDRLRWHALGTALALAAGDAAALRAEAEGLAAAIPEAEDDVPAAARARILLGEAALAAGDGPGALPHFERALEAVETLHDAWLDTDANTPPLGIPPRTGPFPAAMAMADVLAAYARALPRLPASTSGRNARLLFRKALDLCDRHGLTAKRAAIQTLMKGDLMPSATTPDRLKLFQKISSALNSELRLDKLLSLIMDMAIDCVGAERGFLMLKEPDGRITFKAARNIDRETIKNPEFKISQSTAMEVMTSREALLTVDAQTDERFKKRLSVQSLKLRSILCVPLILKNEPIGAVYVDHRFVSDKFNEENLELMTAIADQSAIAIDNARLHEDSLKRVEELAASKREVEALNKKLEIKVERVGQEMKEVREVLTTRASDLRFPYPLILWKSPKMKDVLLLLDRVTETSLPVLIEGESGTGKELVARSIHDNGPRKTGKFVSINCSAFPPQLLESELFGHARGSFTGADRDKEGLFKVAHGGTLFLDEIADMSLDMQTKLLRAIEEGEIRPVGATVTHRVDVRILSATNRPLKALVAQNRFRDDLFFRINVIRVDLPPLRERREDIALLAEHFLAAAAVEGKSPAKHLSPEALHRLMAYDWPGNVRELDNEIRKLAVLSPGIEIQAADIVLGGHLAPGSPAAAGTLKEHMEMLQKTLIERALRETDNQKAVAAERLGIDRTTLYKLMKKYGIEG